MCKTPKIRLKHHYYRFFFLKRVRRKKPLQKIAVNVGFYSDIYRNGFLSLSENILKIQEEDCSLF